MKQWFSEAGQQAAKGNTPQVEENKWGEPFYCTSIAWKERGGLPELRESSEMERLRQLEFAGQSVGETRITQRLLGSVGVSPYTFN